MIRLIPAIIIMLYYWLFRIKSYGKLLIFSTKTACMKRDKNKHTLTNCVKWINESLPGPERGVRGAALIGVCSHGFAVATCVTRAGYTQSGRDLLTSIVGY
jgi:hypothetical protein